MAVNRRGIDTTGMTLEERQIAHWGYIPDDGSGNTRNLVNAFSEALRKNRDAVREAKSQIDGDWSITRKVLRGVGLFTGLYFTRTPPNP